MKTIKELEAGDIRPREYGYLEALNHVLELIDSGEFDKNCYECDKAFDKEELKARITG